MTRKSVRNASSDLVLQGIVSEYEVSLQAVAPAVLVVVVHNVVVEVHVRPLLVLLVDRLRLFVPLPHQCITPVRRTKHRKHSPK
jgi:hypothetical protein